MAPDVCFYKLLVRPFIFQKLKQNKYKKMGRFELFDGRAATANKKKGRSPQQQRGSDRLAGSAQQGDAERQCACVVAWRLPPTVALGHCRKLHVIQEPLPALLPAPRWMEMETRAGRWPVGGVGARFRRLRRLLRRDMVGERRSRPTDSTQPCHPASSRVDALALRGHTTVASANLETKPKAEEY
jgi:hypothetical protein